MIAGTAAAAQAPAAAQHWQQQLLARWLLGDGQSEHFLVTE
jgi:hypothetical protein